MVSIRPLREGDETGLFTSGNADLDRFLRKHASRNQYVEHIGTTYVALDGDRIVGYATVAPGGISADDFPSTRSRKLPRYPLPVLRLGRLAVATSHQKRGIGTLLTRFTFALALELGDRVGCAGVLVDAKPEAVPYYARFGFETSQAVEGEVLTHPAPTPMFLHLSTIRAALRG
jgi:predicted N-acetyltransferase YhbS